MRTRKKKTNRTSDKYSGKKELLKKFPAEYEQEENDVMYPFSLW